MMARTFAFVSTDPSITVKPGKSRTIRSHCMQGKNKREGSRRSRKEKERKGLVEEKENGAMTIVAPSCNESALVRFAGHVGPDAHALLFRAYAYAMTNKPRSPLTRCVDFDRVELQEPEWLFADAAFLHSLLCTSYAATYIGMPTWSSWPGEKVISHTNQALTLLARKMNDDNAAKSESVLYAVINLAVLAVVCGDWSAAAAHFAGLQQIVHLRGGMAFLQARPKLHAKIDRLDLTRSLSLGIPLLFPLSIVSWDPLIPHQATLLDLYTPPATWDFRLATIFLDFQHLALKINVHVAKHTQYNADCFQPLLSTLQSRLMHLAGHLASPTEELVRLTLLAYMTTSFELSSRKIAYPWLSRHLEAVFMQSAEVLREDVVLRSWVLMIARISVGMGRTWVRKEWVDGWLLGDWSEVKEVLLKLMWIECVHDEAGRSAFKWLTKRT